MAIFKVLEIEESVQTSDKTRLSASKAYVSKGTSAITKVEIKPGADESFVDVFVANKPEDWYLDWQFDAWTFDIDSTNNKVDFSEGSSSYVATLTSGTYNSLSTLATEIQTQMNAASSGYTVSVTGVQSLKFENAAQFKLLAKSGDNENVGILKHLGFEEDTESDNEQVGIVEYAIKKITLQITATAVESTSFYIKVYNEYGDRLFSNDSNLQIHEDQILKWVSRGRSSFKNVHRRAQKIMIEWLDGNGYVDAFQGSFNKWSFVDLSDVKDWATYMALRLIFEGISNANDDIFAKKAQRYASMESQARNRYLKIDIDKDGILSTDEYARIRTGNLFTR